MPAWAVWLDKLHSLTAVGETQRGRNLGANPAISVHLGVATRWSSSRARPISPAVPIRPWRNGSWRRLKPSTEARTTTIPQPDQWDNGGLTGSCGHGSRWLDVVPQHPHPLALPRPVVDELIESRKADHLRLSASGDVDALVGPGWDDVRLVHEALPEVDQCAVDLSVEFLGRQLRAPLLIAGMTGGHTTARDVNAVLARAAERHGLAMGVGSQRRAAAAGACLHVYGGPRAGADGVSDWQHRRAAAHRPG